MHIDNAHHRLKSLWGRIDRQHNELIAQRLTGSRILDVGCGYGSLVAFLTDRGYRAEGIDYERGNIAVAREMFPSVNVRQANGEDLADIPDRSTDSIVLKDCMHHLVGEGDVQAAFRAFKRVLVPQGRIVILDPNPNLIVRTARALVAHKDPEASLACTLDILEKNGFQVRGVAFYETIGLPLSGGYVGPRLVPAIGFIERAVALANKLSSTAANGIGLGKVVCWRYIVHADARS